MNKTADQERSLARPLVGTPPQPVELLRCWRAQWDPGKIPDLSNRGRASLSPTAPRLALHPSLLCAGAAERGCHGDGALPARAPPPVSRLRAPRQVRAGRCGAASHCGRCAEGAGTRGSSRERAGTPTPARGAAWKVGKVGGGRSGEPGGAACGVPAVDLGIPLSLRPGDDGEGGFELVPLPHARPRLARGSESRRAGRGCPSSGRGAVAFYFGRDGRLLQ